MRASYLTLTASHARFWTPAETRTCLTKLSQALSFLKSTMSVSAYEANEANIDTRTTCELTFLLELKQHMPRALAGRMSIENQ